MDQQESCRAKRGLVLPYLDWSELVQGDPTGWSVGRHNNGGFELHLVARGSCVVALGEETLLLRAGEALLIAPEVYHGPLEVHSPFLRFSCTFLPPADLAGRLPREAFRVLPVQESLCDLAREICGEARAPGGLLARELTDAMVTELLIRVFRLLEASAPVDPAPPPPAAPAPPPPADERGVIDWFFAFVPRAEQTQAALAELLRCSRRQLVRKLRLLYGTTFREKLLDSRMDLARALLRDTDRSVAEISAACGYSDPAAFYHAFRQRSGVSPAEYRRETRAPVRAL